MRNKKAKRIRNMARRVARTEETFYNIGSPPYFDNKGLRVIAGVPTVLKEDCVKFLAKAIKGNLK